MKATWVSWENNRRSREMSNELDIPFKWIQRSRIPVAGLVLDMARSYRLLSRMSGDVVIVRNPPLLLAWLACAIKQRKGFRVVQDLHSSVADRLSRGRGPFLWAYRRVLRYCNGRADLTVVTDGRLKALVESEGGTALVLQDPVPAFASTNGQAKNEERRIVFVCSFAEDEPVRAVLDAARRLDGQVNIYITGRIPSGMPIWSVPRGVWLTGFLPEGEYLKLLEEADAIMVLTTSENRLLSGAYEGLAFKKPLIVSDQPTLRSSFGDNIIYVGNTADSIADGIRRFYATKPFFDRRAASLAQTLERDWAERAEKFRLFLDGTKASA